MVCCLPKCELVSLVYIGWWRVDARGLIGWAPASYLVPVNSSDLQEEAEENETLIEQDKGMWQCSSAISSIHSAGTKPDLRIAYLVIQSCLM